MEQGISCVKNIHMLMMDRIWSTSVKQQMLSPIRIFTQEQRVCARRNIIRRSILRGWVAAWTIDTRKRPEWNTASCGENRSIAIFLRQSLHKYIKVISVTGDRGGMCSSSEVYYSLVKKPRSTSVARRCITPYFFVARKSDPCKMYNLLVMWYGRMKQKKTALRQPPSNGRL